MGLCISRLRRDEPLRAKRDAKTVYGVVGPAVFELRGIAVVEQALGSHDLGKIYHVQTSPLEAHEHADITRMRAELAQLLYETRSLD